MGIAHVQHELLALHLRPVADADDLQVLGKAHGGAHNHVVDERAGEAVQRAMTLVVAGTPDGEHALVLLNDHVRRNFL